MATPMATGWETVGDWHAHAQLRVSGSGPVRLSSSLTRFGLDANYAAFPGAARRHDGTLLITWRQGADHVNARDGAILLSTSPDDGRTWTTPTTAVPYPGGGLDMRDPSLTVLSDGRVMLTYFKGTASLAAAGCFLRVSTDGGATWGAESRIDNLPYAAVAAPVVEYGNALLVPFYGRSGSESRDSAWVARSTDGGTSWSLIRVANGPSDGRDYPEPWIVNAGGTLVMLLRWNGAESIAVSRSTNGTSWSAPRVAFPGTGRPSAIWLSTGVLVCVYRRRADGAAIYRSSRDLGQSWTAPRVHMLVPGAGWMDYSAFAEVSPGLAFTITAMDTATGAAHWLSYLADGGGVSPLGDNFVDRMTRTVTDLDTVLAADDFDRPDTATGLGTSITGLDWNVGGRIENGTARSATSDNVAEFPVLNVRTPDVVVEADLWWTYYSGHGLMLRYQNADNHFMFTTESNGAVVRFYVRNAGVYYNLAEATAVPVAAGTWHRFRAVIRGPRFLGFIDDQLAIAYNIGTVDTNLLGAMPWHGIKLNESSITEHRCRRFLVKS